MKDCENYIAPMTCLTVSVARYPVCPVCQEQFAQDLHEGTTASDAPRDPVAA